MRGLVRSWIAWGAVLGVLVARPGIVSVVAAPPEPLVSGVGGQGSGGRDQESGVGEQESEPAKERPAGRVYGPDPAAPIAEAGPEIFYVKDKDGKLVPLLNHTADEIRELLELKNQLQRLSSPRPFVVDQLAVVGAVQGERVELDVELTVTTTRGGWHAIPLGFATAALREAAKYQGPGQLLVDLGPGSSGYLAWIEATSKSQHVVRMKLVAPLVVQGDQRRFKLPTPREATITKLRLTTPDKNIVAAVSDQAAGVRVTATPAGSQIDVDRWGPTMELSWRPPGATMPMPSQRLAVEATDLLATVDGQGVRWEAVLNVRALEGPLSSFSVRLPPGATLDAAPNAGFQTAVRTDAAGFQVVDIRLTRPASPVQIRLAAKRSPSASQPPAPVELAGFEVVGAVRQGGRLAVAVDGDWQIEWLAQKDLRPADQLPEGMDVEREQLAGVFEFFGQPFSLTMRVEPQRTRVSVEPTYLCYVERDQVALEATFKVMIRGAKAERLDVQLPDWEIDEIGPAGLVRNDGGFSTEANAPRPPGTVSIPFAQRLRGPLELTIKARRPTAGAPGPLRITLPRPLADSVAPATVWVQPADNVQLTPAASMLRGLAQSPAAPLARLQKRQQTPLVYHPPGGAMADVFEADLLFRSRAVTVDVETVVTLADHGGSVEQTFEYEIAHEPLAKLLVEAPTELLDRGDLKFSIDGAAVTIASTDRPPAAKDRVATSTTTTTATAVVGLIPPRLAVGRQVLTIRYPLARTPRGPTPELLRRVPLVMPLDGRLAANRLRVSTRPEIRCAVDEPAWQVDSAAPTLQPGLLAVAASQRTPQATVRVSPPARSTVVDLAWLQSWYASGLRQDRAVYTLTTNDTEFVVTLPEGVRADATAAWVDSREAPLRWGVGEAAQQATIRLVDPTAEPDAASLLYAPPRRRTVELLYTLPAGRRTYWTTAIAGPRLADQAWVMRTYWQVVLPQEEHLLSASDEFSPEYRWTWYPALRIGSWPLVWYWGRQPLADQADLKTLSAASQADGLSNKSSRYLFSRLGGAERIEIVTASRMSIVLGASLLTIGLGGGLLHLARRRSPWALFVLGVLLLAAGIYSPAATFMFLQASVAGVVAAAVGLVLWRVVTARQKKRATPLAEVGRSTITRVPPPGAASAPGSAAGASQITTQSLPPNVQLSAE